MRKKKWKKAAAAHQSAEDVFAAHAVLCQAASGKIKLNLPPEMAAHVEGMADALCWLLHGNPKFDANTDCLMLIAAAANNGVEISMEEVTVKGKEGWQANFGESVLDSDEIG